MSFQVSGWLGDTAPISPDKPGGLSVGLFGSMTGLGFMAVVHSVVPMERLAGRVFLCFFVGGFQRFHQESRGGGGEGKR